MNRRTLKTEKLLPTILTQMMADEVNLGEVFLLTVGAFLLTVKLLCLHSLKGLIRRTFPL